MNSWAEWKLLGIKTERPTAEVPRGQHSGLGNTGLPSGCSCDSSLGVPREAGHPQAASAQPWLLAIIASLLSSGHTVTVTYCTGQRGRNTNEPDLCKQRKSLSPGYCRQT